jgi:DNA repair exonuclease SbcCD ATPase subunit
MVMTALSHYVSFCRVSIERRLRENWADIATISFSLTVAYTVNKIWGKYASLCFTATAMVTYPQLRRQIEILLHYDLNTHAQATVAVTVAGLCFVNPPIAAGMAAGLAVAIIKREWKLATVATDNAKEIETLKKENEALSKIYDELKACAEKLEQELNICLGINTKLKEAAQLEATASAASATANQEADNHLTRLKEKIGKLSSLCQHAITQKQLLERMRTTSQVEADLTRMTLECKSKQAELAILTQDIRKLKEQLSKVISSLSEQDDQIRARLQVFDQWLLGTHS